MHNKEPCKHCQALGCYQCNYKGLGEREKITVTVKKNRQARDAAVKAVQILTDKDTERPRRDRSKERRHNNKPYKYR